MPRWLEVGPSVPALDVLAAQHEFTAHLSGWQLLTTRGAREEGASWAELADATGSIPEMARRL